MEYLYRNRDGIAKIRDSARRDSAVPTGLGFDFRPYPALKRWAKLFCAAGARSWSIFLQFGKQNLAQTLPLSRRAESLRPLRARVCQRLTAIGIALLLLETVASAQVLKRPHDDTPTSDQNQTKINAKKPKNYPRAIAVIEFLPGGGTRLVPIALWIDDRFYDASLYGANPEPMAVQPETVYEATNYGEPVGLFTVTTPEELKGSWIASGQWKPRQAMDEKLAQQAAKQPKPKPTDDFDSDRPTLHRAGSSGSSGSGSSSGSAGSAAPSTASSGTPSAAESDPNRPTLKKAAESPSPADSSSAPGSASSTQVAGASNSSLNTPSPDENDPNRPVLRRGKPAPQSSSPQPVSLSASGQPKATQGVQDKADANATAVVRRSYPAVSDAGPHESRSLLYAMNPQEHASKSEQMSALALDEIRKFIAARHTPALPKTAAITDYDLRAYDLEYSNSPTLVFTAKLPVAGAKAFGGTEFDYFVSFVAREDFNGQPIKIFSSVTDSNHLDAFPRMEIIDAVDADANGRGDLLFRQYSDTGVNYSLYRVFPYDMQKVFEGGAGA